MAFFNLINILTLTNRPFSKQFSSRMYKQMLLHSIMCLTVCFVYMLRVSIKCIDPVAGYCVFGAITDKIYRYILLTLTNYVGNVLKTCANLIHISIALDRFILSTETKNSILRIFSQIQLKTIFLVEEQRLLII